MRLSLCSSGTTALPASSRGCPRVPELGCHVVLKTSKLRHPGQSASPAKCPRSSCNVCSVVLQHTHLQMHWGPLETWDRLYPSGRSSDPSEHLSQSTGQPQACCRPGDSGGATYFGPSSQGVPLCSWALGHALQGPLCQRRRA